MCAEHEADSDRALRTRRSADCATSGGPCGRRAGGDSGGVACGGPDGNPGGGISPGPGCGAAAAGAAAASGGIAAALTATLQIDDREGVPAAAIDVLGLPLSCQMCSISPSQGPPAIRMPHLLSSSSSSSCALLLDQSIAPMPRASAEGICSSHTVQARRRSADVASSQDAPHSPAE